MSIFTVYFSGTGATRFDTNNPNYWNGELISTLASNEQGREFADWIALDGPGSGNLQADELSVYSSTSSIAGTLFGAGWGANVQHAVNMIQGEFEWERTQLTADDVEKLKAAGIPAEDLSSASVLLQRHTQYPERRVSQQRLQQQIAAVFRKDQLPTQINVVGWSRGAVSCHMLANALLENPRLASIPVRILAIDPVPGALNFQAQRVTLGDNVQEYVGVYARDERSLGFNAVVPKTSSATRCTIFPVPGRHGTLVGNAAADGKSGEPRFKEPGTLVRHLAEGCLSQWGVQLDHTLNLTAADVEALLQQIAADDAHYLAMRKHSYTVLTHSTGNDEREMQWGSRAAKFSEIAGTPFHPAPGLSANLSTDPLLYDELILRNGGNA